MNRLKAFSVDDLVAFVNSPSDKHHGRLGKITRFDHAAEGTWIIEFADGSSGSFVDADGALEMFYRKLDSTGESEDLVERGPRSLIQRYYALTAQGITQFEREYKILFRESFKDKL